MKSNINSKIYNFDKNKFPQKIFTNIHLFTYCDYDNNGVSYCSKRMYDFLTFQKKNNNKIKQI